MNYVPLWVKTDYSILSSLIKIDDLIETLSKYNIKTCAICDDNLYGAMEFYNKCIKNDIKPIIGLEVTMDYTILLYAKNYKGYQNLCNINTLISESKLSFETLIKYLKDLVVVVPFEYKDLTEELKLHCDDFLIGYSNKDEYLKIDGNNLPHSTIKWQPNLWPYVSFVVFTLLTSITTIAYFKSLFSNNLLILSVSSKYAVSLPKPVKWSVYDIFLK